MTRPYFFSSSLCLSFTLKIFLFLWLVSVAFGAPLINNTETRWSDLPDHTKTEIVGFLNPDDLGSLLFASKSDRDLVNDYLASMTPKFSDEEKARLFEKAVKTNSTAVMDFLLRGGPITFFDDNVLLAACKTGSAEVANLFFGDNPKARFMYFDIERSQSRCFDLACDNGHLEFLKATGLPRNEPFWRMSKSINIALLKGHVQLAKYLYSYLSTPEQQVLFDFLLGSCLGDIDAMALALRSIPPQLRIEDFQNLLSEEYTEEHDAFASDPMECAINRGHLNSILFLLELNGNGAHFPITEKHLSRAALSGNMTIMNLLLNFTNAFEDFISHGPLFCAAASGNVEMVKWVIHEAEIRKLTFTRSAINSAKESAGTSQVLAYLTALFGDKLPPEGLTEASRKGKTDVVQFYLNSPYTQLFRSNHFRNALEFAIIGNRSEIVKMIIDSKWQNITEFDVNFLFATSCKYGNIHILQTLLNSSRPADPASCKAFQNAAEYGHVEALKFLIGLNNSEIDPSAFNNEAIVLASQKDRLDALKYLVSLHPKFPGIDPAARNNTAFRNAIRSRNVKMARYLLSLRDQFPRISPSDKNNEAIKVSVKWENTEMVDFLKSLPEEMGVDQIIAEMDPDDVILDESEDESESDGDSISTEEVDSDWDIYSQSPSDSDGDQSLSDD